jgi:hypothetical protein
MIRSRLVAVMSSALVATAFLGVANASRQRAMQPLVYRMKTSAVPVAGTPYHLQLTVETSGDEWGLRLVFKRKAATGNHATQTHEWEFTLPGADAHVDSDLTPASIHTHADLDTFGTIDLALHNPGALSSHKTKCPNGTVTGSRSHRSGTLTGTFDFDANDGYFDTVHRTAFPVDVTKVVSNGKQCPSPPFVCSQGKAFVGGDQSVSVFANRPRPQGHATLEFHRTEFSGPAVILHHVTVVAPVQAFTLSSSFVAKVNGSAAAPFASGAVTFEATGDPTVSTQHHCRTTTRPMGLTQGSVTAKFDSGGDQTMSSGTGVASKVRKV